MNDIAPPTDNLRIIKVATCEVDPKNADHHGPFTPCQPQRSPLRCVYLLYMHNEDS